MKKKLSFKGHIFLFLIFCFCLTCFLKLGFWQLERLDFKKILKQNIKNSYNSPPLRIDSKHDMGFIKKIPIYKRIIVKAKIINSGFALYGARYGLREKKNGYYYCSVIETKNNQRFLINRGWVHHSNPIKKVNASLLESSINNSSSEHWFEAITMPFEKRNFFIPENKENIWFALTREDGGTLLGINVDSYYLLEIGKFSEYIKPLDIPSISFVKDNHLEYAITWFLFALITCFYYIYFLIKNLKIKT